MSTCILCDTTDNVEKRLIIPRHRDPEEGLSAKPICERCHDQYHWKPTERRLDRVSEASEAAIEYIIELRNRGLGFSRIAQVLNDESIESARGGEWHPQTVAAIYEREAPVNSDPIARKGSRPQLARYGYVWQRGKFDGGRFVRDAREQEVIAWIVAQRNAGATFTQIAQRLRESDIPTKRGGLWRGNQVANIYRREAT